jgi:hypothetical protein
LLIALPEDDAMALLAELQNSGNLDAAIIGRVEQQRDFLIELV